MAMNLRLPHDLAEELRALSERVGRSQQELVRQAVTEFVHDYPLSAYPKEVRHLIRPAERPDAVSPTWQSLDGPSLLATLLEERESSR
jgi:ribosomal 50S subunit-associated protein YjgA (DUF615 family)